MLLFKRNVKRLDIIAVMLYIAIFKFSAGPQVLQQIIKISFIGIILIYLARHMKWKNIANSVTVMVSFFMLSSFIGAIKGDLEARAVLDGILYSLCIFCIFGVIQQFSKKDSVEKFIDIAYVMTSIYCVISVISIYFEGVSIYGTEKEYFFGNKFSTSYLFILLAGLYYVRNFRNRKNRKMRFVFIVLSFIAFAVSYYIHCSTATIGTVVLLIGAILPDFIKEKLQSKKMIIILICVTGAFPFFITSVLKIPQVQYLFYQIMGKSMGLTGRLHIYDLLIEIIEKKPLFGYGYNSFIVTTTAGYGNAQNGLMELVVNFGIVGTILFIVMVYNHLSVEPDMKNYGLYTVLYTLVLCSTVEITYTYFFYMALFILFYNSIQGNNKFFGKLRIK